MYYILHTTVIAFASLMVVDALFFALWIASGQLPADGFYFGSLTAHVLNFVL